MSWLYSKIIRPVLFTQDSEAIHDFTLQRLGLVARHRLLLRSFRALFGSPMLPVNLWGMRFPNPVGLAAGMDKRASALPVWEAMGFGFAELGGVTWLEQPGNPRPRMFRAIADEALVNRMGFNNPGAERFAEALRDWRSRGLWPAHPIGVNLGKSKLTPLEKAAEDYSNSFRTLLDLADFFVVNVSSPNTPNLRKLQDKSALKEILTALNEIRGGAKSEIPRKKALLVKIAPDLADEALDEIIELCLACETDGVVAVNTTIARPQSSNPACLKAYRKEGGLSGAPLRQRGTEVIRRLFRASQGQLPIIGVGGIFDADHAWEKITAGASLIQIYTGMVYRGPGVARQINRGLADRLKREGMASLKEAVGMRAGD